MKQLLRNVRARSIALAASALIWPLVTPAVAHAASPDQRVDTYVLPYGAHAPSLAELKSGQGLATLRALANAGDIQARLAKETVGPAASFAPRAQRESGYPAPVERHGVAGAASLADPPRTMTATECVAGLGTTNKFFVKSRYAVCSGASFHQTWLQNEKPTGESQFNVVVIATVPSASREVQVTYHFTDMASTGRTGITTTGIETSATIAKSWPSSVQYSWGGTQLPVTKLWVALRSNGTFSQTIDASAGQGNGSVDLISAIYQPSFKIKPPMAWKLGGAKGGEPFWLALRWDKAPYLPNSNTGAASLAYQTPLVYSAADGAPERGVARHIEKVFTNPGSTVPPSATKKVPGQTPGDPLSRLYNDTKRREANYNKSRYNCLKYFGDDYAKNGDECDEYPFQSTYQGAAAGDYDPHQLPNNFSVMPVPGPENGAAGNLLLDFYNKNRVVDGPDDGFWVQITH
ncbi:NucA/NucB deoxyribonuclease domain-containing protein [Streptomyces crystallinus]|uniref:Deoxyribonuclease NucA/NucB domain-containing protein n=1 Tax=Streptomyces crystallinus TaxID=68191 RepID=A0ABP3S8M7_9ACTN